MRPSWFRKCPLAIAGLLLIGCQPPTPPLSAVPQGVLISSRERGDVPLVPSVFNAPRLGVAFNGVPAEVIIDSGAFASLTSPAFAKSARAEVRRTKLRSVNAGGSARAAQGIAHFETVAIGETTFTGVDAVLHDVSVLQVAREPVVGALGLPVFRDVLLTIDFLNGVLRVERGSLPPVDGKEVLELKRSAANGLPYVKVRVGPREVWALVDTGYSLGLALPASVKKSTPGASATVAGPPVLYYGTGMRQSEQARLAVDVTVGRHVIEKPIADIGVAGDETILGAAYLRHFAVTFDQRNGRVRFARAAREPIRTASLVGAGYYVHPADESIVAIVPGSGAARAGLKVGDKLVAIDGVPISTFRIVGDLPRAREDESDVTYERGGKAFTTVVKIGVLLK